MSAPATPPAPYGWQGANQRSNHAQTGIIMMGVRQYNPTTGNFLTQDPIPGGNANAYTYPTDPVGQEDLDGMATKRETAACKRRGSVGCTVVMAIAAFAWTQAPGKGNWQNARRHFVLASLLSLRFGRDAAIDVLRSHEPKNSAKWGKDAWRDWRGLPPV